MSAGQDAFDEMQGVIQKYIRYALLDLELTQTSAKNTILTEASHSSANIIYKLVPMREWSRTLSSKPKP